MPTNTSLADYYAQRANEYERIYDKAERQADLATLRKKLRDEFAGHDVLEVACGTGYWTEVIAETALSVVAVDINREVLDIAQTKNFRKRNVTFEQQDIYQLALGSKHFTAGLAAFWWSHIPKTKLPPFLSQFHRVLRPGALVVFIDNSFVPGSSTPISRFDAEGNSYQIRTLENGSCHEVLKNFPTEAELQTDVSRFANHAEYHALDFYWYLSYRTGGDHADTRGLP